MPDIRMISPLLENFSVGDSLIRHNGVTCYPALEKETGARYIVKVISIPESALQLEAFLISGVYPNREAALNYFKGLANGVLHEAEALNQLSKLEGFLPIAGMQAELTENYSGYEVYLLSEYKVSLRRLMREKNMTHLGAMNMALDLCAALVTTRNSGCQYVDLKPENIFLDDDGHYKIGDIGFVPISCLKYATLENRYRSAFTPPEVSDPYAPLSNNMDIYALGKILHCIFNTGDLENVTAEPVLESPHFADDELSAIIMKACAVDPSERYASPKEMGQALVTYMQKNTVNDARIIPEEEQKPAAEGEDASAPDAETIEEQIDSETVPTESTEPDSVISESSDESEDALVSSDEANTPIGSEEPALNPEDTKEAAETSVETLLESDPAKDIVSEFELPEIFWDDAPEDQFIDIEDILTRADTEIYHEFISPDISILAEEGKPEDSLGGSDDSSEEINISDAPNPVTISKEQDPLVSQKKPRNAEKSKKTGSVVIGILAAALLCACLFLGYRFYYLQNIDNITVNVNVDSAEVILNTDIPANKLQIVCTDTYGNAVTSDVLNNAAIFHDLKPGTQYQAKAVITGFHKLVGSSSVTFSTPVSAEISDLTVLNGSVEGTALVSFHVTGQESANWNLSVISESGDHKLIAFSGHSVEVPDLALGVSYTLNLSADDALVLSGTTSASFIPMPLITAENLTAVYRDGSIQLRWNAPAGYEDTSWIVTCADESGNAVSQAVDTCSADISGVAEKALYKITITAPNMSQGISTNVATVAVQVQDLQVTAATSTEIRLEWVNNQPDLPLTLIYTVDGVSVSQSVQGNSAVITGVLPGAKYDFTFQTADGEIADTSVSVTTEQSGSFSGYGTGSDDIIIFMCEDPETENWSRNDIPADGYTTTFTAEQKAAFLFYSKTDVEDSDDIVNVAFAVRNADKDLVDFQVNQYVWKDMWNDNQFPISLTCIPNVPGNYNLDIYFNDHYVNTIYFNIV